MKKERLANLAFRALNKYGADKQLGQMVEEAAELIVAIQKYRQRSNTDLQALITEIADVQIMITQMRMIFGESLIDDEIEEKLDKLEKKLERENV